MKLLILLSMSLVGMVHGYHILCIFAIPSRSHNILGKGIVDALLEAGHEVTWATPYPPTEARKGLNIVDVSVTVSIFENLDMIAHSKLGMAGLKIVKAYSRNITKTAMTADLRSRLVNVQYDAVVTEMLFSEIEAGYAAVQGVPWIVLAGSVLQPPTLTLVDAANSVPIIPSMFADYPLPLNFWQRMMNALVFGGIKIMMWLDSSTNSEHYESMFSPVAAARGVQLPSFEDALYNISVLFVNSHPSFAPAHSLPPNVVDIAGYHVDDNIPPLPKDLQELLDSSPQGVIYFSMGSVLQSATFPEQTRKDLLKLFGELPYTVLWKFEEQLDGLPKNVHIRKWMPQASILAHPNVKVFITHGGILSNIEAVYHGVPLVSIPLYGDQPANANRAARAGYAIRMEYDFDTMAAQLKLALNEMLGTDSYYKQVKYLSALFRNRPVAPSKLISHYVEVAIASKGAYHLRSKALSYTWYQRCMLDLAAFALTLLIVIYYVMKKIINYVLSFCRGAKKNENRSRKVKKN